MDKLLFNFHNFASLTIILQGGQYVSLNIVVQYFDGNLRKVVHYILK